MIADARTQEKTPAAPQAAPQAATAHASAQVLVIEDDVAAHDLTCRALERLFMTVECVAHGEDGLARIAAAAPALVVLDINLPDISGWTVLERIKASPATRDIPVLVVTIEDDRARAMALGACDHMVKPVDRDRLVAAAMRYALRRAPEAEAATVPTTAATDAKRFG
jgi:CheY-like chemotaxis protein